MGRITEALTASPTVVFTAALAFARAWWTLAALLGGLGAGHHHGAVGTHSLRAGGRVAARLARRVRTTADGDRRRRERRRRRALVGHEPRRRSRQRGDVRRSRARRA